MKKYFSIIVFFSSIIFTGCGSDDKDGHFDFDGEQVLFRTKQASVSFSPKFMIIFAIDDPKIEQRPAGIENVQYNVPTWQGNIDRQNQIAATEKKLAEKGDGFDDSILEGEVGNRTANVFAAGETFIPEIENMTPIDDHLEVKYKENSYGQLTATFSLNEQWPEIRFEFIPAREGYYSIGYIGAEEQKLQDVQEIWQPLIWQEMRFPSQSFMTMAFRCPVPGTLITHENISYGILAHPDEFPYSPLPIMNNSRFGVVLRNEQGNAQPMLFAPVLGGIGSQMKAGNPYAFKMQVWAGSKTVTDAYKDIAEGIFGFRDYRKNDIASLNTALNNMIEYSLSEYAWFLDSLKGCAYSTDVPGAVKNVSALNPLELSLVADHAEMFDSRAYPILEYMLSREKFLFSLDPKQKIQNPSRKMSGPVAPITELAAIYSITGKSNPFLIQLAKEEYGSSRIRNLEVKENGRNWKNAFAIYKATGENVYLKEAIQLADEYLKYRETNQRDSFDDTDAQGFFFWPGYTNEWISLLELYEITKEVKYLKSAHDGARHYAMFCWMSPIIPDDSIQVNKGGKAPIYWYLKSKGHEQMEAPEEMAPAWRLSEIGLTAESSGTSTGHRGIFMTNYAPWMLRLGYYVNDTFLQHVAKSAIIGRYRNFPGYHMNTERTTVYEKEDYPLKAHKKLSYNSFHYNHILPMASLLLDYLVTDTYVRSKGAIDFPSEFIEGYAYLQSKFYGHKAGSFYGKEAWLWMPDKLLQSSSVELNFIAARGENSLMVAFANQSDREQEAVISFNKELLNIDENKAYQVQVHINNDLADPLSMQGGVITIKVPANGLVAVEMADMKINTKIQEKLSMPAVEWKNSYAESKMGDARMMIINAGSYAAKAFVYLREDDSVYQTVTLSVRKNDGKEFSLTDRQFPFEFTLDIDRETEMLSFRLSGLTLKGKTVHGEWATLSKN